MQWQEYQEALPSALAGLGATPMHHDGAWWVSQSLGDGRRVLRFPTMGFQPRDGGADQEGMPGVALGDRAHQTPDEQRWRGMGSKASQTPDQQRWHGMGAKAFQTPDEQRWQGMGSHAHLTPDQQKWGGMGAMGDAGAFTQAATDLHNQVELPIGAGDTYLQNGDAASALSAYKAAGQVAASTIGPEIDGAGAPSVTQSFTQFAWGLNGQLAAATDATAAQGLAKQILVTLQDAVSQGNDAIATSSTPQTNSSLMTAAQALQAYLTANGVPSSHVKVAVVGTFQQAYVAAGNALAGGVDQQYGPATASALRQVLGSSPAPVVPPSGTTPTPTTTPSSTSTTTTTTTTTASDPTTPILVGAGIVGVGLLSWGGWTYWRKRRHRR